MLDAAHSPTALYLSTLPSLITSIEHMRGRLRTDQPAHAEAALRRTAHALRGSGRTYGFNSISQSAAAVEEAETALLHAAAGALIEAMRQALEEGAGENGVAEFRTARPRRILLVDDDPSILLLAGLLLRRAGHDVVEASDAAAAVTALAAARPDLLLIDVLLGDEDGISLAQQLRAHDPAFELVFLTAAHDAGRTDRMNAERPAAILHKPFDPALLALMLEQRLGPRV